MFLSDIEIVINLLNGVDKNSPLYSVVLVVLKLIEDSKSVEILYLRNEDNIDGSVVNLSKIYKHRLERLKRKGIEHSGISETIESFDNTDEERATGCIVRTERNVISLFIGVRSREIIGCFFRQN